MGTSRPNHDQFNIPPPLTLVDAHRIHGIRSLAYFGPWTGATVIGNKAAQVATVSQFPLRVTL